VPVDDFESIRPGQGARYDALHKIDDQTFGNSSSTLIEQAALDPFHGCLYLKKFASLFNEDDILDVQGAPNSNCLVCLEELLGFALLAQALAQLLAHHGKRFGPSGIDGGRVCGQREAQEILREVHDGHVGGLLSLICDEVEQGR